MILLDACLHAPLTATSKRWPGTFHAAEMGTIIDAWPGGTVTAACGAKRLRLVQGHNGMPGLWPPAARSMLPGWTRCRACWVATGKKRPRSKWVPAGCISNPPENGPQVHQYDGSDGSSDA